MFLIIKWMFQIRQNPTEWSIHLTFMVDITKKQRTRSHPPQCGLDTVNSAIHICLCPLCRSLRFHAQVIPAHHWSRVRPSVSNLSPHSAMLSAQHLVSLLPHTLDGDLPGLPVLSSLFADSMGAETLQVQSLVPFYAPQIWFKVDHLISQWLPRWPSGSPFAAAGDMGSIPGSEIPGRGSGSPLQYSCPGIPCTEEPGGCRAWGCRVEYNWAAEHTSMYSLIRLFPAC